jgi:hypothetical protein
VNDVALIAAGALGLVAAAAHGMGGEVLVLRKLSPGTLPPTRFGGGRGTRLMIHATWHTTTIAYLAVGVALLLSGSVLDGDARRSLGLTGAAAATGFAALNCGMGAAYARSSRFLTHHPGPALMTLSAALAWLGTL